MKEKRKVVISLVLALIFVAAAAISAAACGRTPPEGFSENPVNPLEGKNLQTPKIELVKHEESNEYRGYFEYNMQTYYLTNKVFKIQDSQEIFIGELISYSGSFKAYGTESRSRREAFYLNENYIYICMYIYISEGSYGGCGSYQEGFSFGKYQAVRFNLDTSENEEITNEIFFENIK